MTRKKIIILTIVGIGVFILTIVDSIFDLPLMEINPLFLVLYVTIVIPIAVIIIKKNEKSKNQKEKKEKTDEEIVDNYISKLNAFLPKEVTIDETSGTITQNKNSIEAKIKALIDFPQLPARTTWEVKDSVTPLTTSGVEITLVVKKDSITKEILGFSVKRS